jgi:polyferredoxin
VYGAILAAIAAAAAATLWLRVPIRMDVIRDRASLAREVEGARIENVFRLQVMNTDEAPHRFAISASGAPELGPLEVLVDAGSLEIAPVTTRMIAVRVRAAAGAPRGSRPIAFTLEARDGPRPFAIHEKSRFLVP